MVSRGGGRESAGRRKTGLPGLRTARAGRGGIGLAVGLGLAQVAFAATFRGPRGRFWNRMTATGLALGSLAVLARPDVRGIRFGRSSIALGGASAAALYVTFLAGDRFARRFVPGGGRDIASIYGLRELRSAPEIAVRLVAVIAPAEELFWRGLVQQELMDRFGRWRGAALATATYSGAHVVSGNFTLVGAAGVAGAHWCALYAAGVPLEALIVSHAAWDTWTFLVRPTAPPEPVQIASADDVVRHEGK